MIDNIQYNNSGKKINISIDNETISIPIYDIVKSNTFIELNTPLDTPLYENINLDATLYSYNTTDKNEIDFDDLSVLDFDGIVNVTIFNKNNTIYYSDDIHFKRGHFQCVIKNQLPIGNYKASINFAGNKYLKPSKLDIYFNVEKRLANISFDKKMYYGYPKENININGKINDSLTDKFIPNCIVRYTINNNSYISMSDEFGNINLSIQIPEPNKVHCSQSVIDNDETIINETNTLYNEEHDDNKKINSLTYIVNVEIENNSYTIKDTKTNIIINKIPTHIELYQTKELDSSTILITGNVFGKNNNQDEYVNYGNGMLSFEDSKYTTPINIDNGTFEVDVDINNIIDNTSQLDEPEVYDTLLDQDTITNIQVEDNSIDVGDRISVIATVKTEILSEYIQGGMVVFELKKNNKTVYKYGTQTGNNGQAKFYFNTSKTGTYQVSAHYYGLFGFLDSESNIETIKVL